MSANFLDSLSALILTYNEAPNLDRTLAKLSRVGRIVVVDSGSDDGTQRIAGAHSNTRVVERPFDSHSSQWSFGLTQIDGASDWVLALDADYVLSDELMDEIANLSPASEVSGYRIHFRYCIFGDPIRCGAYPPVIALYRKERARYVQDGHTQRVVVDGRIEDLIGCIYHDDRKPLSRWLDSQKSYARHEADHLEQGSRGTLRWQDRIRMTVGVAPVLMFCYVYVLRGGFLDGRPGLYYALQRAYAELLLSLELLDRRLRRLTDR